MDIIQKARSKYGTGAIIPICRESVADMVDLISRLVDRLEWKSIESAPKDGSVIYALNTHHNSQGRVRYINGEWEDVNNYGYGTGGGFYPDLWLPLPPRGDK